FSADDGTGPDLWRADSAGAVIKLASNFAGNSIAAILTTAHDFNFSGTADLLLHNSSTHADSVWLMNGIQVASSPVIGTEAPGWKIPHTADFNGDGKSYVLLQTSSTLQASVWLMNG